MTLVELLIRARTLNVTISRDGADLILRGPKAARSVLQLLGQRKSDVLAVVDVYNGVTGGTDWRGARVTEQVGPCVICRHDSALLDPWDGKRCHKVCFDAAVAGVSSEVRKAA